VSSEISPVANSVTGAKSAGDDKPCTLVAIPEMGECRFFIEDILHRTGNGEGRKALRTLSSASKTSGIIKTLSFLHEVVNEEA
jgi:hypothetical protein